MRTQDPAFLKQSRRLDPAQQNLTQRKDRPACACACACVFGTSRVGEEDEAPDTGGAADEQARGQHGAVRHPPAEPAHQEEAQDDLQPAQAVHQAVGQLAEAEQALRHRCHHGLGEVGWGEIPIRDETKTPAHLLQEHGKTGKSRPAPGRSSRCWVTRRKREALRPSEDAEKEIPALVPSSNI